MNAKLPAIPSDGSGAKFTREARLLRHADFDRVYKAGRRHFAADMTVFYLPRVRAPERPESGVPRVGITVSRALGGAVVRNRMKRRLREAVRECYPELETPVDVVINPKKSLLTAEFRSLQEQVRRAFKLIRTAQNK